ncbi:MAG: ribosome biogenesis GTP-binding protein YsxC [Bdellovibrionales bacterium]|nr:ribosome biogenesis GTP-binding protein YsxC [Bdellovibrionales bacterium]
MAQRFNRGSRPPKPVPKARPQPVPRPRKKQEIEEPPSDGWIATVGHPSQLDEILQGDWLKGFPDRRVAFVGRSNVGKSSLINKLMERKGLARVSRTPGKTRTLNFFRWPDENLILVDLPGYGFAKASPNERDRWQSMISVYLKADPGLSIVLVLLDARHGPTPADVEAVRFIARLGKPIAFVFTKSDELKNQKERAARKREGEAAVRELGAEGEGGALWISAREDFGMADLRTWLREAAVRP